VALGCRLHDREDDAGRGRPDRRGTPVPLIERRSVSCHIEAAIDDVTDVALAVAVARGANIERESMVVTLDGAPLAVREVVDDHGTRLHLADAVGRGALAVAYEAEVSGVADPIEVGDVDRTRYRRTSRYCESDRIGAFARSEFRELEGRDLLDGVSSWVGQRVAYVAGSSRATDGAVSTLLAREGVCRDFAHLVIALLRGCDVPARMTSVYAPGLQPMDFHAVAEALVDDQWLVVDATCLAPRTAMVRIATGRDAADTAFLTSSGGSVELRSLEVAATIDGELPFDDVRSSAQLR
jgi:transglutaminase-like putative cysteine protease